MALATNLKKQGFDTINTAILEKAMKEIYEGHTPQIGIDSSNKFLSSALESRQKKKNELTKNAGEKFLQENKKKEGVITLPSGLQYQVLKKGDGAVPTADDKVTTHYTGTLIDGTVFDSSVERGQPATVQVKAVIPGWIEALQLMPVGSKWRLFIPYNLAYGETAAGPKIPAYSTLIFDVELLSIEKK